MSAHAYDRRRAASLIFGSAIVSALGVGALAYTSTNAAFTGTTENGSNAFEAATVTLTDDDGGSATFNIDNMVPGDTVSDCILVTYTGSSDDLGDLKLYGASSGDLADDLILQVRHGAKNTGCASPAPTTGLTDVYASALLTSLGQDYANGETGLTPDNTNDAVPYYFDITLNPSTPNSAQGDTAEVAFTWEVISVSS